MTRQSTITKSDIQYLIRLMHQAEEKLVAFGLSGCQKTGFNDDMWACVDLLDLKQAIDRILDRGKTNGT
ncbi:hypothetical protein LCGC14_1620220 [marine sediment metagenome]|uniref:Uncharacterized protein n=1 Tax=marine sediment metagenome TaxID=412755 RepID=A0A0F9KL88_9ZZZZ